MFLLFSVVFNCAGRPNGNYPDPNNCYGYIACSNGHAYRMPCPAGLVWNDATKRCDWKRNVPPPCGTLNTPTTGSPIPTCAPRKQNPILRQLLHNIPIQSKQDKLDKSFSYLIKNYVTRYIFIHMINLQYFSLITNFLYAVIILRLL